MPRNRNYWILRRGKRLWTVRDKEDKEICSYPANLYKVDGRDFPEEISFAESEDEVKRIAREAFHVAMKQLRVWSFFLRAWGGQEKLEECKEVMELWKDEYSILWFEKFAEYI